ncbi:uncharacterized protein TRIADDRAFT_23696, partial [Trichoplax adhaerens]
TTMELLRHALSIYPMDTSWLRTQGDFNYIIRKYPTSLRNYIEAGAISSSYFLNEVPTDIWDDLVYRRMISCCSALFCHTQAAVLCQFLTPVDFNMAIRAVQQHNSEDAMETYYHCIWETTILEAIIHLHSMRGEYDKQQIAMSCLNQPELNSYNSTDILLHAMRSRKRRFLVALAHQYLHVILLEIYDLYIILLLLKTVYIYIYI